MKYEPRFITGMTVEEIDAEMKADYERQYRYGYAIDRARHWDLEYTKKVLKAKEAKKMDKVKVSIDNEHVKSYIIEFASEEDAREAYVTAIAYWVGGRYGMHDAEELEDNQICVVCTSEVLHRFLKGLSKEIDWK